MLRLGHERHAPSRILASALCSLVIVACGAERHTAAIDAGHDAGAKDAGTLRPTNDDAGLGGHIATPDGGDDLDSGASSAGAAAVSGGRGGTSGRGGSGGSAGQDQTITKWAGDAGLEPKTSAEILRSTPGRVRCGPGDCAATAEPANGQDHESFCCDDFYERYCAVPVAACESGTPYFCDEAADCAAGLHCCRNSTRELFSCQASCDGQPELCKTGSECENGQTCIAYNCLTQAMAFCGTPPSEYTQPYLDHPQGRCQLAP